MLILRAQACTNESESNVRSPQTFFEWDAQFTVTKIRVRASLIAFRVDLGLLRFRVRVRFSFSVRVMIGSRFRYS